MKKMRKLLSILLCLCMLVQNFPVMAFAAAGDGLCAHHTVHTAECGYVPAAAEVVCTHEHTEGCSEQVTNCLHAAHDESCGGLEDAAACTHVCSADSGCVTTVLNCGHSSDGSCCYVASVAETPCSYAVDGCSECDVEEEKTTEPSMETSEPTTETTEPALVCNCGTDDPAIHATTCAVYVVPENPVCYCAEKCTEPNVWCDVCGFDYTQCAGQDAMTAYDETTADPVTLDIANGTITISATGYKQYRADEIAYTGSYIITGTGTNNITVSGLAAGATITLKDLSITSTQISLNLQDAVPVAATGSVKLGSGTCIGSTGAITITGDADLVLTSTSNKPAVIATGEVNIQCNSLSLTAQGLAFKTGVTKVTVDAESNITASTKQTASLIPCAAELTAGGSISLTAQNGPVVSGNADLTAGEDITLSTKGQKTVGGTATLNYAGTLTETTSKGTATEEHVHSFENGICTGCGTTCSHEDYEDGKCTSCGTECPHKSYSDGKCTVCGALALVKVQVGESVTYYPGIDEANAYAGTLESGDTVYITLLGDTGASDSIFKFAAKTIVLDLNGHTMTVQRLQYESGADVTVKDSGADGTIQVTLDHYVSNGASLTLKSGSILNSNTGHPAVYVKGSFNMTGGTVSGANQAINVQSGEKVHISGGTISGGSSKALTNPDGVKNIFLSGGTYIGGINASPRYDTITLSDILAQGYKLVDEDGSDVELYNSTVDGTVKVVCAHTLDHADNKPATCKAPAYCGNCGVTYGEPDADAHSFGAGGLCTNGCGTQAQAKIDNTFYLTFAKAAEEVTEGSTITVFTDVTIGEAESLNFPYFVTLSVAEGKTITCDGTITIGTGEEIKDGILFKNKLYYLGELYETSGSKITGINLDTATPNTYYPAGKGYAIYEGSGILRLHNAVITTPDDENNDAVSRYAIYSTNELTIHFSGNNQLKGGKAKEGSNAIHVEDDLILIAEGENPSLTVQCGNDGGGPAGIEAQSLTVNGGTVTAIGGNTNGGGSYGIFVNTALTVSSGTVYARGGSGNMSFGVCADFGTGTITVADDAALYATGGEGTVYSAGVFAGTVSDNVNALGLTVSETENAGTMTYTVYGELVLTEDRAITNPYAGQEGNEEFTVTVTFTVPAGTSLTVNEGVTLDLTALAAKDIHFDGTITNNGTILLPDGFGIENAPKGGNVTIGDKSYSWTENGWLCGEGSHTGTFVNLGDGNHGYQCSVCETQISEPHTYNASHVCTVCGVTETYTITVATEGLTANVTTATYGQECKITLTSPENTLIYKADAVYTDTNASVPGYTFENGVLTIPGEAVTGDMTVKAMIQVWITIYSNGATLNPGTEDFEAREGEVVSDAYLKLQLDYKGDDTAEELMEIIPFFYAKEGYTLTGINSKEDGSGTAYTGLLPLEQHLTVYLQWEVNTYSYQVETYTMDTYGNYELTNTDTCTAPYGTTVDVTPGSVAEGFYLDTQCADSLLNATVPANNDLVLKVYIGRNKYPITWDLNGGTYYDDLPEKMYYGTSQLNVWDGFTREGYSFSHLEDQFGNKYEDASPNSDHRRFPNVTMPIGGLTLKVMWTVNQYTITFDPDNGEEKVTITQDYGTTITAPENPTKEGYHFEWDQAVPATMPGEDLTITAIWEAHYGGTATCEELAKCGKCGTEYGELAEHTPGYTASGKTITETCQVCDTVTGTATIFAEDVTYTGEVYTGAYTEYSWMGGEPTISYNTDNGSAPVKAGDYTVSITCGNATASDTFKINPKDIANCSVTLDKNSFDYSGTAPALTVNAVDNGVGSTALTKDTDYTVGTVQVNAGDHKLTVTGIGNYEGSVELDYTINAKEVTITGTEIQAVTYDPDGYTLTVTGVTFDGVVEGETLDYSATAELKGINAAGTQGTEVTVTLKNSNYVLKEATVLGTVTINKAASTVTAAPTARKLTYNGNAQELVSAGSTTDGTMKYSLDGKNWNDSVPTRTNAGDYTVWYYVEGDGNHSDSAKASVKVTIAPAAISGAVVTVNGSYTYDSTAQTPTDSNIVVTLDGATLNINTDYTVAVTNNVNAGEATVTVTGKGNYTGTASGAFTIIKADSAITKAPEAISGLKFQEANGKEVEQILITAGEASGGTMVYRLSTDDEWSESIPVAGQARTHSVYYKVLGDSNHNDTEESFVAVTIAKADAPIVTIPAQKHFYTIPTTGNRIDIKSLLPKLCAIINEESEVTGTTADFITNAVLDNGILTYDTVAASAPETGTITVKIVMRNYEDVTVTVNVELIDLNPVSNSGTDAKITYNGSTYDVAQMFTKDTNAGEASYEIIDGSGAGELNGSVLTITKAGTIQIKLTTVAQGNYAAGEATATLTVEKGAGAGSVKMDDWTYGETAKTPTTENGTGTDILFLYTGNDYRSTEVPTDAGEYTVIATFPENDLYKAATAMDTFVIAQKELTPSISGNVSKTYDGTTTVPDGLSIMLDGIVIGDSISAMASYAYDGADAGTTKINATNITLGGADAGNYTLKSTTASADVGEITKADPIYEAPAAATLTYNGSEQALLTGGSVTGGRFQYSLDNQNWSDTIPTGKNAENYTVYFKVVGDSNHNDNAGGSVPVTIGKRDVTITAKDQTITYGDAISGTEITAAGMVDGHSVTATLTPGTENVTANGTIIASAAVITADGTNVTDNYNVSYTSGKLVIEPDTSKIDALTTENVTSANEADIQAVQEMMDNADSIKEEWAAITATCEDLIDKIEAIKAENARIADAAADFDLNTVKSSDEAAITALIADIDEQLATNNLTDAERAELEGLKTKCNNLIAKIDGTETLIGQLEREVDDLDAETVKSTDKATLEQVIADAQTLIDSGNVTDSEKEALVKTQEDAQALIKVIDDTAAENKELTDQAATFDEDTVNSTDKENLEQLAKDIEDLLDTQNLTEDERTALETVLERVEGMIDTINETAEDSKEATDTIDALDPATVTSDDKDELEQAIETIDKLLTADHLTEDERKALQDAKADAEALIEKIEAVQDATDTENTEKVEDVTAENVGLEDKEALEDAKADLEKALEDNAGNYTEEEKKAIQEEIQRIDDAIAALENVEDVTDSITQLPETVEPDDEAAAEKILDAKKAYDALTDHEKSLVDKTTKEKLDDLVAALTDYKIIKGNGGKWTKGTDKGLKFVANGPFSKFVGVEVDGKDVSFVYYTAEEGSTIVTLKPVFLKRLETDWHTLTVIFEDGEATATFKILPQASSPSTGDESNVALWGGMSAVSLLCVAVLILNRKKVFKK